MTIEGKIIVFTGRISKPREEFRTLVEESGGIFQDHITKKTNYLVVGEKPGSKLMQASLLGVPLLSEEELLKLLTPKGNLEEIPRVEETCEWCNRVYSKRERKEDHRTCPVCRHFSRPKCPHCKNSVSYSEDIELYHCFLCGTWFRAPYSEYSNKEPHIHLWYKESIQGDSIKKYCICGTSISLSKEDTNQKELTYQVAPEWVSSWRKVEQSKEEIKKFLESLTEDQIRELEKYYGEEK